MNDILSDAERVSKSGGTPRYTRDQAEAAMLELAKAEARPGEGVAGAFARLCESDSRFQALYDLGQAADIAEEQVVLTKADPGDRFTPLLMQMAKYNRREGETLEACAARLVVEDPVVRDAYAATQGL